MNPGTQTNQANVEYFFRLIYDCFHGGCSGPLDASLLAAFLARLWLWIIYVGYLLSIIGLFVIIYATVRLFELRKREEEYYGTLVLAPDAESGGHPRWRHIQSLAEGATEHEWREAVIEADIMLDDVLVKQGYEGAGVGEKLQSADQQTFATLQDAWEAHKVRNQIAHEGSAFKLPQELMRRTVARYENVFREFKAI